MKLALQPMVAGAGDGAIVGLILAVALILLWRGTRARRDIPRIVGGFPPAETCCVRATAAFAKSIARRRPTCECLRGQALARRRGRAQSPGRRSARAVSDRSNAEAIAPEMHATRAEISLWRSAVGRSTAGLAIPGAVWKY